MNRMHLLLIDPQNDFCDIPAAELPPHPLRPGERIAPALPVAGAHADMQRLARWLNAASERIEHIHVTLDSHQPFDIAHPGFWRDEQGRSAPPFTVISHNDVR